MSSVLYVLGRWAFRARILVVIVWIVALAAVGGAAAAWSVGTDNTYVIPGTESQEALDSLARTFPEVSGTSAQLVVAVAEPATASDAEVQSAIEATVAEIESLDQVSSVASPYASDSSPNLSADGAAALVPIQLAVGATAVLPATSDALQQAGVGLAVALPAGSEVAVGGQLFAQDPAGISVTELVGLLVAFVVLILTFGALAAAALPLVTALVGVGVALSIVLALTGVITVTSTTPLLALMLGLAVGIDYGLFIVARHQEHLRQGLAPEEAAARALATSGSAVVFAATTVVIALLGLAVAGIPFLTTMGAAASLAVVLAVAVSLTLTPALLGFAGWHAVRRRYRPPRAKRVQAGQEAGVQAEPETIEPVKGRTAGAERAQADADAAADTGAVDERAAAAEAVTDTAPDLDSDTAPTRDEEPDDARLALAPARRPRGGFFGGWVRAVTRWPIVTVLLVVAALGAAAVPAMNLRLALPDAGSLEESAPGRVAYDLIAEHFGPGYNGPLLLTGTVIESSDPVDLMNEVADTLAAVPGVASVPLATPNDTGDTGIVQVIPEGAPDSEATEDLVTELRGMQGELNEQYGVQLSVTGYTAAGIDVSDRLAGALLPFGILVVGLSLVLLAMVFRSIVVPLTAAAGYALSIGAALGLTSLVFVDGVLAGPLAVADVGGVVSFMPIILMGVLFGLAMDYEVFLVSRMREHYVHTGDSSGAVRAGFIAAAPVVTAAAIIMIAVFAAFVPEGDAAIQPIAFGLAVGVAIDAFLVRMTLIPALLRLFGRAAWRMPHRLERVLPTVDVEGEGVASEIALESWPVPSTDAPSPVIAAERAEVPGAGTFDALVGPGEALVVHGADAEACTSVLLTLCARRPLRGGRLKVAGFVLPARTGAVRRRSAYVRLSWREGAAAVLADALATRPQVLVLDGGDEVPDPQVRDAVASIVAATMFWVRPPCIVIAVRTPASVADLLPAGMPKHLLAVLALVVEV